MTISKGIIGRALFNATLFLAVFAPLTSTTANSGSPGLSTVASPTPSAQETSPAFTLLPPDQRPDGHPQNNQNASDQLLSLEKNDDLATLRVSTPGPFSPYIGAGLEKPESSESELEALVHRDQSTNYRLGAGLGYQLGGQTRLGLDYRYTPAGESPLLESISPSDDLENDGHRISFGLKIRF